MTIAIPPCTEKVLSYISALNDYPKEPRNRPRVSPSTREVYAMRYNGNNSGNRSPWNPQRWLWGGAALAILGALYMWGALSDGNRMYKGGDSPAADTRTAPLDSTTTTAPAPTTTTRPNG